MNEDWTELIIGVIMMISPWILGFSDISVAKWCNVLLGLAIVLLNAWMIFGQATLMPLQVAEPPSKKESTKNKK
jgi:SPW repeat-containing protein